MSVKGTSYRMRARRPRRGTARPCSCGKTSYTHDDAERVAKRYRQLDDEPIVAYRCRRSKTWHVGHAT